MSQYSSRFRLAGIALLAGMLGTLAACTRPASPPLSDTAQVERGAYLVAVGGCNDCHTPKVWGAEGPQPDKHRLLSGHPANAPLPKIPVGVVGPQAWGAIANNDLTAWVGPWGVSFASNLTPDATGLAGWTAESFIQTLRTGKHLGVGRPILPPMPWYNYAHMSDEELRAVFAYLHSLPPVSNAVPLPIPPVTSDRVGSVNRY